MYQWKSWTLKKAQAHWQVREGAAAPAVVAAAAVLSRVQD